RDDPRWTAYALDELSADERGAFERELALDPAASDEVRALRTLGAELRDGLREDGELRLDDARRVAILAAARRPRTRRRLVCALAAAAGLLLVLGGAGWWLGRPAHRERADSSPYFYSIAECAIPAPGKKALDGLGYDGDEPSASIGTADSLDRARIPD